MASIYQRGRVWWICFIENGQKFDKSLRTKDKKIARYKKNEIENRIDKGEDPLPDTSLTANTAFEEFKKARKGRIVAGTADTDNYRIERFIKDAKIFKLSHINEGRLKAHLDIRIANGLSHRTANHTIRIIKTFLTWAVRSNKLAKNTIAHMNRYKVDQVEPRFLKADEVRQVLEAAKNTRIYLVMAIAVYTGMRQGEIIRLEWKDIDFEANGITVRFSKPGKFRKIPLHGDLAKILEENRQKSGLVYNGTVRTIEWELVLIRRALPDIAHFRFHDLRHTFASLLIKSGVDIYTVSKLLGHAQVTTTQIYSHLYEDHVQDAVKKLSI